MLLLPQCPQAQNLNVFKVPLQFLESLVHLDTVYPTCAKQIVGWHPRWEKLCDYVEVATLA